MMQYQVQPFRQERKPKSIAPVAKPSHFLSNNNQHCRNVAGFLCCAMLRNNGRVELEVDQPCRTAVVLLMLVIHGRTRQVPRAVSKTMLVEIAVLVDYYECYEAVEVFSDMWVAAIETAPEKRAAEALDWVLISWVFSKKAIFNQTTLIIINSYRTAISADEIPLPAKMIGQLLPHCSLHLY